MECGQSWRTVVRIDAWRAIKIRWRPILIHWRPILIHWRRWMHLLVITVVFHRLRSEHNRFSFEMQWRRRHYIVRQRWRRLILHWKAEIFVWLSWPELYPWWWTIINRHRWSYVVQTEIVTRLIQLIVIDRWWHKLHHRALAQIRSNRYPWFIIARITVVLVVLGLRWRQILVMVFTCRRCLVTAEWQEPIGDPGKQ